MGRIVKERKLVIVGGDPGVVKQSLSSHVYHVRRFDMARDEGGKCIAATRTTCGVDGFPGRFVKEDSITVLSGFTASCATMLECSLSDGPRVTLGRIR